MKKNIKIIITSFILLQLISVNFTLALETDNLDIVATTSSPDIVTNDISLNSLPGLIISVQENENILPITENVNTDTSIPLQTSNDVPLLQDTINTQEGSEFEVLTTPSATNTNVSIVEPVVVEPQEIIPLEEVTSNSDQQNIQDVPESTNLEQIDNSLSIESFTPIPVRQFSLTSNTIKTKKITKNVDHDTLIESENLITPINPTIDNKKGTLSLSGSCSSAYFVVLLFKNPNDYIDNPTASILNKAFDCVNNSFSYTVDELPKSLKNGTYYLMIGQQGNKGTWTPISDLTEVVINN